MNRREFGAVVAAVALAGCRGRDRPPAGDEPTPTTTSPEPTETAGPATQLDLSRAAVQPGFATLATPDSLGVVDEAGQYLLVHADVVEGDAPPPSSIAVSADGGDRTTPVEGVQLWRDGDLGGEYRQESGTGWLAFGLPETVAGSDLAVTWPGGSWKPPEPIRTRLAAPLPSFDVSASAPATVGPEESPVISIEVANTGETRGTAVLALNRVGPRIAYAPVRSFLLDLEAGGSRTLEWQGEPPTADRDVTFHLRGAGVERRSFSVSEAGAEGEGATGAGNGTTSTAGDGTQSTAGNASED